MTYLPQVADGFSFWLHVCNYLLLPVSIYIFIFIVSPFSQIDLFSPDRKKVMKGQKIEMLDK